MKDVPCMNDEQIQIGIKLCDAVKCHPCLYDPLSPSYQMRHAVAAAWKVVAKDCIDTAANCRFRWKTIRSSFTRSFRKFGIGSQYYLYDHLDFLVPHMSLADRNDNESIGQADENNAVDKEEDVAPQPLGEIIDVDSDTTKSVEETCKSNGQEADVIELDQDNDAVSETSQVNKPERIAEGRPSRVRKTPKRIYEPDASPERQLEKRPKRILERRKSVGGLVLREYMRQNDITADTDPEPQIVQHMISNHRFENPIEITDDKPEPNQRQTQGKEPELKRTTNVGIIAKPRMRDSYTLTDAKPRMRDSYTLTDGAVVCESADKAIQCEEYPRTLDDEFLETLRPQIKLMNFRQKINFKQRVYRALMEVLDDAKNFPIEDDDDIIELPAPIAKHFESATNGELRLMRELVSLVQAAKMSSEVMEANSSVTVLSKSITPPPATVDEEATAEGLANDTRVQPQNNSPNKLINVKSTDSLGIPRHILQKAVQVTGNTGGTLLAQSGDKRRVYRIYPKTNQPLTSTPNSVEKITSQGTSAAGTFFVTPPKPQIKVPPTPAVTAPVSSTATATPPPMRGTAIQYPKIIKTTALTMPMLPPSTNKSPALSNGFNGSTPTTATKISINTHVPSANIFRRRYSICGTAPSGNSSLLQGKVVPLSGKSFTPPPAPRPPQQNHHQLQQQQQRQPPPKIQIQTQPKMLLQHQLKVKQQHQLMKTHQQLQQQSMHHMQMPQRQVQLNPTQHRLMQQSQHSTQQQQPTQLRLGQQQQHQVRPTSKPTVQQEQLQRPRIIDRAAQPNLTQLLTSNPSQIQISKPVSLSPSAEAINEIPTPSHASLLDPTNGILEGLAEGNDSSNDNIPVLETAGTIAADSFESEFPKPPFIKMEPEE